MRNTDHLTRRLLAELPSAEELILTLRIVRGYSCSDVADELGLSISEVRRLQHRALYHLSQIVATPPKKRAI